MKVTITFDSEEEEINLLLRLNRLNLRFVSKENIENILSSSLFEALRSSFLRRVISGQIPLEIVKNKNTA